MFKITPKIFCNFKLNYLPVRGFCEEIKPISYQGFDYYPRHKDFKDPPYTPSKLFFIRRLTKNLRGYTKEEKKIAELLNIDGKPRKLQHINVVKNIPEINALLWKIKHCVEIKPITYKGDLPKDGDFTGAYINYDGELIMRPVLKVSPEEKAETDKYVTSNNNKLRRSYLKHYLKQKWLNGFSGSV